MDLDILSFLADHRSQSLTKFFSVFTYIGSEYVTIGIACFIYWCFNRKTGTRLLLTMLSSLMLSQLLKFIFVARRPWMRNAEKVRTVESAKADATGYSFPSGHTSNAASFFGGLAYGKKVKKLWKITAWVFVALVAFSRLYLGVHTPQDILAGFLLSAFLICVIGKLSNKLEEKPSLDIPICIVTLALSIITLLIVLLRSYPADHLTEDVSKNKMDAFKLIGASLGMVLGWLMERRLVGFDKPTKPFFAAFRFVIGLILVLGILVFAKKPLINLLGDEALAGVFRYFVSCFAAIFVWPFAFNMIEKRFGSASFKG